MVSELTRAWISALVVYKAFSARISGNVFTVPAVVAVLQYWAHDAS